MKQLALAILVFVSANAFAQDYRAYVSAAESHYKAKDFKKSADQYKNAFSTGKATSADLYNAACSAALSGNSKLAFDWLHQALEKGWTNVSHLKSDTDLASLHQSKKWNGLLADMQKALDIKEAKYDKNLQAKLLKIYDDDQNIRLQCIAAQKEFGFPSRQLDSLIKIMLYQDSINLIKVSEILDTHGWVGPEKVGSKASQTLFLVIQHATLQAQQKYLPTLRDAVKNKTADAGALAYLEDRVALREGRRQIYGTQVGTDKETRQLYIYPIEDPDNVDKRRAEVGLGLLADYLKQLDVTWDLDEHKRRLPELDELQRRNKIR